MRRDVRVLLIRHGESTANLKPGAVGGRQSGVSLSQKGEEQALKLGKKLAAEELHIDEVYASVAVRASSTARIACQQASFDPQHIEISDRLVEMSQGGWEQQDRKLIYTSENLQGLRADRWEFRPPGPSPDGAHGESQRDIEERLLSFIEEKVLIRRAATNNPSRVPVILIFCHGLLIKAALRGILGSSPAMTHRLEVGNTAVTELRYSTEDSDFGGWHLERLNDISHLRGMPLK